jgi:hypothetical protein
MKHHYPLLYLLSLVVLTSGYSQTAGAAVTKTDSIDPALTQSSVNPSFFDLALKALLNPSSVKSPSGTTQGNGDGPKRVEPTRTDNTGKTIESPRTVLTSGGERSAIEKERERIRLLGDYPATFRNAQIITVVRALAEHANMRYVTTANEPLTPTVTISGVYNTLDLLDILQNNYGVNMVFERDTWHISKLRPDSLVYRSYHIKNNSREMAEITSPSISNNLGSSSGSGGSGGGSGSATGSTFKVSYDLFIKDIETLIASPLPSTEDNSAAASAQAPASPTASSTSTGKVAYIAETNELLVLTTAYHHDLVKQYLTKVDKPIDQIEFSAYFIESTRSPKQGLGIDWTNSASSTASGQSTPGSKSFQIPKAVILNKFQFAAALKFTASDESSSIAQSPTVVGMPNRKTVLDATTQVPVAQSSTENTGSTSSSTTSELKYLSIGTIVNIFPVIHETEDGVRNVRLHVSLVVSSITGEKVISGNPAPITASRRFEFSMEVPDEQTLVIGGLVSSSNKRTTTEVPFLGRIPFVGRAFRFDSDEADRTNLTVFITPRILKPNVPAKTLALPRVWPNDLQYVRPIFDPAGATLSSVHQSLEGFYREIATVETYHAQGRDPSLIKERITGLNKELEGMSRCMKTLPKEGTVIEQTIIDQISAHTSRLSALRRKIFKDMGI